MLMQQPCSQGSHGKLAAGYEVGKLVNPSPQLSAEAAGRVQAFSPRPGRHSESGPPFSFPRLCSEMALEKGLCLPGMGESVVCHQPGRDSIIIFQGPDKCNIKNEVT